jgi:subtilisin family serine protease
VLKQQSISPESSDILRDPRESLQWFAEEWGQGIQRRFPLGLDQKFPQLQMERAPEFYAGAGWIGKSNMVFGDSCEHHAPMTSRSLWLRDVYSPSGLGPPVVSSSDSGSDQILATDLLMHDDVPDGHHDDLAGLVYRSDEQGLSRARGTIGAHGTHGAGIMIAKRNRVGVAGVVPGKSLLVFGLGSGGLPMTMATALVGLADIKRHLESAKQQNTSQFRVLLLGYAAEAYGLDDGAPLELVLRDLLRAHNLLVIAPAGNRAVPHAIDETVFLPAALAPNLNLHPGLGYILALGASDICSRAAWFSNTVDQGNGRHYFAPGYGVYSTLPHRDFGYRSGTSGAAALVAGIASGLADRMRLRGHNAPSARHIAQIMLDSARPMSLTAPFYQIDAKGALQALDAASPTEQQPKIYDIGHHDPAQPQ